MFCLLKIRLRCTGRHKGVFQPAWCLGEKQVDRERADLYLVLLLWVPVLGSFMVLCAHRYAKEVTYPLWSMMYWVISEDIANLGNVKTFKIWLDSRSVSFARWALCSGAAEKEHLAFLLFAFSISVPAQRWGGWCHSCHVYFITCFSHSISSWPPVLSHLSLVGCVTSISGQLVSFLILQSHQNLAVLSSSGGSWPQEDPDEDVIVLFPSWPWCKKSFQGLPVGVSALCVWLCTQLFASLQELTPLS